MEERIDYTPVIDVLESFEGCHKSLMQGLGPLQSFVEKSLKESPIMVTESLMMILPSKNESSVANIDEAHKYKDVDFTKKTFSYLKEALASCEDVKCIQIPFQHFVGTVNIRFRRVAKSYDFWSHLRRAVLDGEREFQHFIPDFNNNEAIVFIKSIKKLYEKCLIDDIKSPKKGVLNITINQTEYTRLFFDKWIFFLEIYKDFFLIREKSYGIINNLYFTLNHEEKIVDLIIRIDDKLFAFILDFDSNITQKILMQKYYSLSEKLRIGKKRFFLILPNVKESQSEVFSGFMGSPVLCGENYYEQFYAYFNEKFA